ncbi:MAG: hypothetical protein D3926_01405 [Desulfobacteraceae bacterium]|nr:MAG: hypothetical protein D3926_01405 [Desulfobacteraceae bacterium]
MLASSLAFATLLIFSVFDYQKGEINEIYLNFFMCLVIIVGNTCVLKFNLDRVAYCVGINLVNLTLIYDVSIGAGDGGGLFWLPVMPLFIFFFLEKPDAIISAVLFFCCSIVLLIYPSLFNTYPYELNTGIRYLISLFFVNIIAYGLESSRYRYSKLLVQSNNELKAHKEKLEAALSDVETLSGLLPICAKCKKVRDDGGYWNQIETYIEQHSKAEFSHGICPECTDSLYGDQNWYIKMKTKRSK